jgi:flavin reductase (DIM6/NTAB) family NADH-FMN oxidoreductase RutF
MRRKTIKPIYSMCVQPSFIIGTNNEDGSYNFAPITWVSATYEGGEGYLLVISMSGTKKTRQNVNRTGIFSANLVNKDMLPLMDYLGSKHAAEGNKDDIEYGVSRGEVLDVPTLNDSPWVYECEVERSVETGESVTFFCHIRNIQVDENLKCEDTFDVDLTVLDPVIYSGRYHSLGSMLGKIGDFNKNAEINAGNANDVLDKFHRRRLIMYLILAIGVIASLIGLGTMTPAVLIIGIIGVMASLFYGLFSGAMCCPYCGEILGRRGFGDHCQYCGKKIF